VGRNDRPLPDPVRGSQLATRMREPRILKIATEHGRSMARGYSVSTVKVSTKERALLQQLSGSSKWIHKKSRVLKLIQQYGMCTESTAAASLTACVSRRRFEGQAAPKALRPANCQADSAAARLA
jgi:hypothetical protein